MIGWRVFSGLAEDRDVYAIEIVGHGIAPNAAGPHSFERCAQYISDAVRAKMAELNVSRKQRRGMSGLEDDEEEVDD